jgi:hypothetical protein
MKRPSLLAGLQLSGPEPPSNPQDHEPVSTAQSGRKPRPDIVHSSVYIPKAVHRKLREIAFTTDRKVHDLILDGIDGVLKSHGHAGIDELRKVQK